MWTFCLLLNDNRVGGGIVQIFWMNNATLFSFREPPQGIRIHSSAWTKSPTAEEKEKKKKLGVDNRILGSLCKGNLLQLAHFRLPSQVCCFSGEDASARIITADGWPCWLSWSSALGLPVSHLGWLSTCLVPITLGELHNVKPLAWLKRGAILWPTWMTT